MENSPYPRFLAEGPDPAARATLRKSITGMIREVDCLRRQRDAMKATTKVSIEQRDRAMLELSGDLKKVHLNRTGLIKVAERGVDAPQTLLACP